MQVLESRDPIVTDCFTLRLMQQLQTSVKATCSQHPVFADEIHPINHLDLKIYTDSTQFTLLVCRRKVNNQHDLANTPSGRRSKMIAIIMMFLIHARQKKESRHGVRHKI